MLRLDYISCVLTILSTVLVGRKLWHGWIVAGANSVLICIIGIRTAQFGFIPANLFCIALYSYNLHTWRRRRGQPLVKPDAHLSHCLRLDPSPRSRELQAENNERDDG